VPTTKVSVGEEIGILSSVGSLSPFFLDASQMFVAAAAVPVFLSRSSMSADHPTGVGGNYFAGLACLFRRRRT
jgi:hypothetical protein